MVLLEGVGSGRPEAGVELELDWSFDKTGRGTFRIGDTMTRVPSLVGMAGVDEANGDVVAAVVAMLDPMARERKLFEMGIGGAMRAP